MTDNTELLKELARAKAVFQLRTISTVLGLPAEQSQSDETTYSLSDTSTWKDEG